MSILKTGLMLLMMSFSLTTASMDCPGYADQTPLDLMLLIDRSASVGFENFEVMKKFLNLLVDRLDIGLNKTRVGVISFFQDPRIDITLGQYENQSALKNAISEIVYDGSGEKKTKLLSSIKQLTTQFFNGTNGDRHGVRNTALIITDGKLHKLNDVKLAVTKARTQHMRIIPVGVANVKVKRIKKLSEFPKTIDENYFIAPNFTNLDEKLADEIIIVVKQECPPTFVRNNCTKCSATCDMRNNSCENPPLCICPDDQYLRVDRCVKLNKCDCRDSKFNKVKKGKAWLSADCRKRFTCQNLGNRTEEVFKCPIYKKCDLRGTCKERKECKVVDYRTRNTMLVSLSQGNDQDVLGGLQKDLRLGVYKTINVRHATAPFFTVINMKFKVIGAESVTIRFFYTKIIRDDPKIFRFDLKFDQYENIMLLKDLGKQEFRLRGVTHIMLSFSRRGEEVRVKDLQVHICLEK